MKKRMMFFLCFTCLATIVKGQEEKKDESPFSVSMDMVNRYIWRGTDFGNTPQFQPGLKYAARGLSIGAWGSYSFSGNYQEADLYASYFFPFGLKAGITDYYFPAGSADSTYFSRGHSLELNGGFSFKSFSLAVNTMLSTPAKTNDIYVELGYTLKNVTLFAGAGNEAYTSDGKFMVCNTGLKISHELKITENFSLPVYGMIILNPQKEQIHLVAGITF